MSRYSPSLFIGLGGSGTKIVRWLKKIMQSAAPVNFNSEPLVFRAFDFDRGSNGTVLGGVDGLGKDEFHPYPPQTISDCIRALYTNASGFDHIRAWYPDLAGDHIVFAQADAAGAAQWRPLGRVGFFVNYAEIQLALGDACTEAHARSGGRDPAEVHVWIVSSLGGGTGSGMLTDVAATIRKLRPNFFVRAFLLLPELFESIAFKPNVIANTYAALKEIAAFTNQTRRFTPVYTAQERITEREAVPPFQEVLLIGPYRGRRQPFRNPDEAYQYLAQTIEVASIAEARSGGRSDAANNHSGGAAKSDATASHVFGTLSGLGLPLLTYQALADFIVMTMARELQPGSDQPLLDVLRPTNAETSDDVIKRLTKLVGDDPSHPHLDKDEFEKRLREWVSNWAKNKKEKWTPETLRKFSEEFKRGCGLDSEPMGSGSVLDSAVADARKACKSALAALTDTRHPSQRRRWAEKLRRRFPIVRMPEGSKAPPNTAEFAKWLKGGRLEGVFKRPVVPQRIEKLVEETVKYFEALQAEGQQAVYDAAIGKAIHDELAAQSEAEEKDWKLAAGFARELLQTIRDPWTERRASARFDASPRMQGVAPIVSSELRRYRESSGGNDARFPEAVLSEFRARYEEYQRDPAAGKAVAEKLRDAARKIIASTLAVDPSTGAVLPFVPVESVWEAGDVEALVASCDTPLFRAGQWNGPRAKRIARIVVPSALADYERTAKGMASARQSEPIRDQIDALCRTQLRAFVSDTITAGGEDTSVSLLIEDVSHPAQQLEGIFRYDSAYMLQEYKDLFHIERGMADALPPLIGNMRIMVPLWCGNDRGCTADLRGVPRGTIFCPGCQEPIRSRCGNEECTSDELMSHPSIINRKPPRECPLCHLFMRTYWWRCDRHGDIPIDKIACPYCVRAGFSEREIRRRSHDAEVFDCPHCLGAGRRTARRFTGDAVRYIRHGVNGFNTDHARRVLKSKLECGALCPSCHTLIAPMCPVAGTSDERHYTHRPDAASRWVCSLGHGPLFTCGVCDFPVLTQDFFCRRCHSSLGDCRFCTVALGIRVAAAGSQCSVCGLDRLPRSSLAPRISDATDGDRFCSDLYGCRAGAAFANATYDAKVQECFHCHGKRLPLMDAVVRPALIAACGFCALLIGADRGETPATPATICPLCGQSSVTVNALLSDAPARDVAVVIGRSLLHAPDDDDAAFRKIVRDLGALPSDLEDHLVNYHARVARREVLASLRPRIERLIERVQTFVSRSPESSSIPSDLSTRTKEKLLASDFIVKLTAEQMDAWIADVKSMPEEVDKAIDDAHRIIGAESRTLDLLKGKWMTIRGNK